MGQLLAERVADDRIHPRGDDGRRYDVSQDVGSRSAMTSSSTNDPPRKLAGSLSSSPLSTGRTVGTRFTVPRPHRRQPYTGANTVRDGRDHWHRWRWHTSIRLWMCPRNGGRSFSRRARSSGSRSACRSLTLAQATARLKEAQKNPTLAPEPHSIHLSQPPLRPSASRSISPLSEFPSPVRRRSIS